MPGISQKRFHSTSKGRRRRRWTPECAFHSIANGPPRSTGWAFASKTFCRGLDFESLARALRHSTLAAFRRQIRAVARRIGRRGIRFETAAAALNRLFEICLPYLRRAAAVGLARLHALVGMLMVSEYAGEPGSAASALAESDLTEAQRKLRDGSLTSRESTSVNAARSPTTCMTKWDTI